VQVTNETKERLIQYISSLQLYLGARSRQFSVKSFSTLQDEAELLGYRWKSKTIKCYSSWQSYKVSLNWL